MTDGAIKRIPDIAYNTYRSRYQGNESLNTHKEREREYRSEKDLFPTEPSLEEGFKEIQRIPFSPEFESEKHRRLFLMRSSS
jgi:hypothetical protein